MVVDPPDGLVPVLKWAEDKRDYDLEHLPDAPEHETPWVRCITRGYPAGMFPAGYNNAYQIIQTPGYVVLVLEMIHETRIIPIDGRPKLGAGIKQWNGEPRGRWEGNTLVVESTNYNDKGSIGTSAATGRMRGIPQSPSMKVTERFTPVGPDTIDYRVTIEDPKVYSKPWTVHLPLNRDDSYQMFEVLLPGGQLRDGQRAELRPSAGSRGRGGAFQSAVAPRILLFRRTDFQSSRAPATAGGSGRCPSRRRAVQVPSIRRLPATGFWMSPWKTTRLLPPAPSGRSASRRTWNFGGMPVVESCPSGAGLPGVMSITAAASGTALGPGLIVPEIARPSHFMTMVRSVLWRPVP